MLVSAAMKPRVLVPRKILAVALTAVTGCAGRASTPVPEVQAEPPAPTAAAQAPGAMPAPAPTAIAEPPPALQPRSNDPALFELQGELFRTTRDAALANVAHFRPLCDADGYPLVGNAMSKSTGKPEPGGYQASAFCSDVRKQAHR
jgi:hypothetical protein